jgi:phage FluMu gp28-like protein
MTKNPLTEAIRDTTAIRSPAVLLPYQQEWIADDSQLKLAEKSRRVGITWAEASDDVLIATRDRTEGGQNVYYIGYNMDMAIEFIEACAMWSRVFDRAAGAVEEGEEIFRDEDDAERRIKTYTIKFPSGFRIVALSSRPANLRGKQGVVVIDEAAFHDKLGELIKAAIALLIWGGKVRIISTHNGEDNPFNELLNEIRAGKRSGSIHRIEFREAVAQGLYRRVCMRLKKEWTQAGEDEWVESVYKFYGDDATEELDVVPSSGEGAYLQRAQIVATQDPDVPVLRWSQSNEFAMLPTAMREAVCQEWLEENVKPLLDKLDKRRAHFYGSDFARIADLSVIWPVEETLDTKLRTPFVVELRNIPYEQQKQVLFYVVRGLPNFRGGANDAGGNGGYLAEVAAQEFGALRIQQVKLSASWYVENMPRFKAHFEDKTITTPADADVLADLRGVRKIRGVPKVPDDARTTGIDGKPRHGDSAIALVLAMYAVEMIDVGPIEYEAAPQHPRGFDNTTNQGPARMRMRAEDPLDDIKTPEPSAW